MSDLRSLLPPLLSRGCWFLEEFGDDPGGKAVQLPGHAVQLTVLRAERHARKSGGADRRTPDDHAGQHIAVVIETPRHDEPGRGEGVAVATFLSGPLILPKPLE